MILVLCMNGRRTDVDLNDAKVDGRRVAKKQKRQVRTTSIILSPVQPGESSYTLSTEFESSRTLFSVKEFKLPLTFPFVVHRGCALKMILSIFVKETEMDFH